MPGVICFGNQSLTLPGGPVNAGSRDTGDLFSLSNLGSQLKVLGSRIQEGGRTLASGVGSSVELPPFLSSAAASSSPAASAGSAAADSAAGSTPAAAAEEPKEAGGLEADPDLEAYLQVGTFRPAAPCVVANVEIVCASNSCCAVALTAAR